LPTNIYQLFQDQHNTPPFLYVQNTISNCLNFLSFLTILCVILIIFAFVFALILMWFFKEFE
jgi:disulfide bond formation protein DsbB